MKAAFIDNTHDGTQDSISLTPAPFNQRALEQLQPGLLATNMTTRLNPHWFDLQGHRGARGLAPENTLPAFAKALEIGVHTLELDTAVTRDHVVVVAHDRRLNPDITRDENGAWLQTPTPTVHSLGIAQIKTFDVGRINPASDYQRRFPLQFGADGVPMPTLAEVFALVRRHGNDHVRFNIETKLSPLFPEETPPAAQFVGLLVDEICAAKLLDRVTIQSFDWRTLRMARSIVPNISVSFLSTQQALGATIAQDVESPWTDGIQLSTYGSVPRMIAAAAQSFSSVNSGVIWSPHFADIDEALVEEAHAMGLSVLPWTLNEPGDIARAIELGVDGLITDYPDRARAIMARFGLSLPE